MKKVRAWNSQPSDRGRLKNRRVRGRTLVLADGECEVDGEGADCSQLTETSKQHQSSQVVGPGRPLVTCVLDMHRQRYRREHACRSTHSVCFFVFSQFVGQVRKVHETDTLLLITLPNVHRLKKINSQTQQ